MQTSFSPAQLSDPRTAEAEGILRKCVHCGFCTATCPTFVLLGDERDSPRGRIYLIKDMLEKDRPASATDVRHIDRCLTCLSCVTTCPSGVDYRHLVDTARNHIEKTYRRPLIDRALRMVIAAVLPFPSRFRLALRLRGLAAPLLGLVDRLARADTAWAPVAAMMRLGPKALRPAVPPRPAAAAGVAGTRRMALMTGCVQSVLAPSINQAASFLLSQAGVAVIAPAGERCCGALTQHLGKEAAARATARATIDSWIREMDGAGLEAIVITASGCGTTIKDYGHMFADDPRYADKAARVAAIARDVSEVLVDLDLGPPVRRTGQSVAYHSACSMQHGQSIRTQPKALLAKAGFAVRDVPEGHLCCGSAGTYNIFQPEIAGRLRDRKLENIDRTHAEIVATGNIGCITQLSGGPRPVVHTVELLAWAYGGPLPAALRK
jgi:glycolate oxidase iron-sulfur subunit